MEVRSCLGISRQGSLGSASRQLCMPLAAHVTQRARRIWTRPSFRRDELRQSNVHVVADGPGGDVGV